MLLSHKYGAINLWIWSGGNLQLCGEGPPHADRVLRLGLGQYGDWRGNYDRVDGRALALRVVAAAAPLGYVIGPIWIMDHLWFNMFIAWGIKVIVLKYGVCAALSKDAALFHGDDPRLFHPRRIPI